MYINVILLGSIELFCALFAGMLVLKFEIKRLSLIV